MELFEAFHPEWEKGTWKQAADTSKKPEKNVSKNYANVNTNAKFICKYSRIGGWQLQIKMKDKCKFAFVFHLYL